MFVQIISLVVLIFLLILYMWISFRQLRLNSGKFTIGFLPSLIPQFDSFFRHLFEHYSIDTKNMDFVEAGAGIAHNTHHFSKLSDFKSYTAVEIDGLTALVARFYLFIVSNKKHIKVLQTNTLDYELQPNSFVYCYLGSTVITEMHRQKKFQNCFVVSVTFPIKSTQPTETIPLKHSFFKRVYIYDFREK